MVALLAEGVDRNVYSPIEKEEEEVSPSSRRAWIEIPKCVYSTSDGTSRPPRGGRG